MANTQETAIVATAAESIGVAPISRPTTAEQRLRELGLTLPAPVEPLGTYVEAVQTGNLLFLSGVLPTEGSAARVSGRVGGKSMSRRDAVRLTSRRSTSSLSRGSIWDRSTR